MVAASGGYPGDYEKNKIITGLSDVPEDILVFHAGTKFDNEKKWVTNGGRVLAVTAVRPSLEEAIDAAYSAMDMISFEGKHFRSDIGARGLNRN